MTELELYRKMYAKVVGEADGILQSLAGVLTKGDCGRKELIEFGERLKRALLDAEEIYMSAEDEADEEDDYEGGVYVYRDDESDSLYQLALVESVLDSADFSREIAAMSDKKISGQEKRRRDAGNEEVKNQEA